MIEGEIMISFLPTTWFSNIATSERDGNYDVIAQKRIENMA